MERYRRIRRYGVDKKYIVLFELSDNSKYYIANGYKFVLITNETTIEDLKNNARQYSLQGARVVGTKLWKEFSILNEIKTRYRIIQSSSVVIDELDFNRSSIRKTYLNHIKG